MTRYFDHTDLLGWHLGDLAAAMLASMIKIQGRLHDIEREGWRMVKYECVAAFLEPIAVRLDYRIALQKEDFPADGEIVFDTEGGFRMVTPRPTTSTPAPDVGVRPNDSSGDTGTPRRRTKRRPTMGGST